MRVRRILLLVVQCYPNNSSQRSQENEFVFRLSISQSQVIILTNNAWNSSYSVEFLNCALSVDRWSPIEGRMPKEV